VDRGGLQLNCLLCIEQPFLITSFASSVEKPQHLEIWEQLPPIIFDLTFETAAKK
jgi:hypothetical protein